MALELAEDRVLATIDRLILVIHDRPGACCFRLSKISCKSRNGRNHNDHPELSSFPGCTDASINDGLSNGIEYRFLLISSGRD